MEVCFAANLGLSMEGCDSGERVLWVGNVFGLGFGYPRLDLTRIDEVGTIGVRTSLGCVRIEHVGAGFEGGPSCVWQFEDCFLLSVII